MKTLLALLLFCIGTAQADPLDFAYWQAQGMPRNAQRILASLRSANFNSAADQPIIIPSATTKWVPAAIWITNCSTSMTTAVGGFYTAASKGGTALVAASQTYLALTGATVILPATLAANVATTALTGNLIYLSLTTAQGSTATCDVYVIGVDLT